MRRLEQQTAAREQRMRAEAEDLQQRCAPLPPFY
jgi:hypothetical protein